MRLSTWKKRLPVKGCGECSEGVIHRHNNTPLKCKLCEGTGVKPNHRALSAEDINIQITKNLKQNDRN